jgi:hypothetical protein
VVVKHKKTIVPAVPILNMGMKSRGSG